MTVCVVGAGAAGLAGARPLPAASPPFAVLERGRVAELGSHGDLVRREGTYASLVLRQTRGLVAARRTA